MKNVCLICLIAMGCCQQLTGQGFEISVKLDNYKFPEIYLATFEGGEPQYRDTALLNSDSLFVFSADTSLSEGVYLLLTQPRKQAFQLLITHEEQRFRLHADAVSMAAEDVRFEQSRQNERYYEYLRFAKEKHQEQNKLYAELDSTEGQARKKIRGKINSVAVDLYTHQELLIKKYPGSLMEMLIRLDNEPLQPEFSGTDEAIQEQGFRFRRNHFFDGVPLTDPRIIYSPLFYNKINFYLEKMTAGSLDSVMLAIDEIFARIKTAEENFSTLFSYLMKKYESPKIVGQDAVFVRLADQYLDMDIVPGIAEADKNAWRSKANKLRPVLIGMPAPDVSLQLRDGTPFSIYDVNADFTVLIFWRPNCGHCKKAIPILKELQEKYKNESVQLVGICTQYGDGIEECWKYVDEHGLGGYLQAADRFHRSKFMQKYNAQRTPKIYILDHEKKIIIKDIGAEHIDKILQMKMVKDQ